jgi:hypothetical protein
MFFIVFNFIWFQLEKKLVLQRALSEGYNADRLVCDLFCISFVDSLQARSTWISFLFVDCKRVRWQLNCNRICDNVRTWTIWQAKLPEMMTLKGQALCRRTGGKSRVKRFSDKKEKEKRCRRRRTRQPSSSSIFALDAFRSSRHESQKSTMPYP